MTPHVRLLVGRSVIISFKGEQFYFHAPIRTLVFIDYLFVSGGLRMIGMWGEGGRLKNVAGLTWIPDIAQNDAASETYESINES